MSQWPPVRSWHFRSAPGFGLLAFGIEHMLLVLPVLISATRVLSLLGPPLRLAVFVCSPLLLS